MMELNRNNILQTVSVFYQLQEEQMQFRAVLTLFCSVVIFSFFMIIIYCFHVWKTRHVTSSLQYPLLFAVRRRGTTSYT